MSGRPRGKKHVSKKTQKDATTQTSPDKNDIEISHWKEEANSLRQKLMNLERKFETNSSSQKQREEVVIAVADSPQHQKLPAKGCNCRGKCANRICGCVKRQVACTPACNCSHSKCENKDLDKENIGGLNAKAQIPSQLENNTKLMAALKLRNNVAGKDTEGAAGPSTNQLSKAGQVERSLFSPETPETHRKEVSVSNLQINTPIQFVGLKKTSNSNSEDDRMHGQIASGVRKEASPNSAADGRQKATERDGQRNKKRLISPYYDGKKPRSAAFVIEDIAGMDSPVRNRNVNEKELEFGINPMKPTRQLQRTPVSASVTENQFRRSESPFSHEDPVKVERPSILEPPQGIDEPHVNWEEHCKQLVPCRLCSRTFYPHRIEKHEASCKRV